MKVQLFFIGLISSFGIAWLFAVAFPFYTLRDKDAIKWEDKDGNSHLYAPTAPNTNAGAIVYRQENCQTCHTRVIRHSQAGSEVFKDWAGKKYFDEDGNLIKDTRRESHYLDYSDKKYASIGSGRMGPDLINYGVRITAEVEKANLANKKAIDAGEMKPFTERELIYLHLYNPRKDVSRKQGQKHWSNCPSNRHLFEKVADAGQTLETAPPVKSCDGYKIVPSAKAKALADFLIWSKHDQMLPESESRGDNFATE